MNRNAKDKKPPSSLKKQVKSQVSDVPKKNKSIQNLSKGNIMLPKPKTHLNKINTNLISIIFNFLSKYDLFKLRTLKNRQINKILPKDLSRRPQPYDLSKLKKIQCGHTKYNHMRHCLEEKVYHIESGDFYCSKGLDFYSIPMKDCISLKQAPKYFQKRAAIELEKARKTLEEMMEKKNELLLKYQPERFKSEKLMKELTSLDDLLVKFKEEIEMLCYDKTQDYRNSVEDQINACFVIIVQHLEIEPGYTFADCECCAGRENGKEVHGYGCRSCKSKHIKFVNKRILALEYSCYHCKNHFEVHVKKA